MKKILVVLTLISFLAVMAIPMVASAQAGPVKCVKLGTDVKWSSGEIKAIINVISGKVGATVCTPIAPCVCTPAAPCTVICYEANNPCLLQKDGTVGETDVTCTQKNKAGVVDQAPDYQTPAWGIIGLLNGIGVVTNWIFVILMIIVGLFAIWGAFDITTAAGAPEKVTTGRNKILYALIGLAVALLARALPSIVSALLGV